MASLASLAAFGLALAVSAPSGAAVRDGFRGPRWKLRGDALEMSSKLAAWRSDNSPVWAELLEAGALLRAIYLSADFADAGGAKNMSVGGVATVRSPGAHPSMVSRLIAKIGAGDDTAAIVWLGDDNRVYICFQYMRRLGMVPLINGAKPVRLWQSAMPSGGHGEVRISSFIMEQLDRIWSKVKDAIHKYAGEHAILLCGLSYGAVLAQASALRLALEEPHASYDIHAVTWNGFKWINEAGAQLMNDRLGWKLLPFVVSERTVKGELRWDPIPHSPGGGSNQSWAYLRNLVFVTAHSGCFMNVSDVPEFYTNQTAAMLLKNSRRFLRYTGRYHVSAPAERAMWKATRNAQPSFYQEHSQAEVC